MIRYVYASIMMNRPYVIGYYLTRCCKNEELRRITNFIETSRIVETLCKDNATANR